MEVKTVHVRGIHCARKSVYVRLRMRACVRACMHMHVPIPDMYVNIPTS